jgi:uncharacterized protein YdeI (YjbR/CyaY-like superfamily)
MTESKMKTLYVANRQEWRAWLKSNYQSQKEIWLIYYKTHTGKPSIAYEDAVEEALCYGWIDSIIKKIDDEKYARKFTPRTNINRWSQANVRRVKKALAEGNMTEAGLAKILGEVLDGGGIPSPKKPGNDLKVSPYLKKALTADKIAWVNFNGLAPSHRRDYILWIDSAKKKETRARRIKEALGLLAQDKKLGLK